jgi:hypothetical protein
MPWELTGNRNTNETLNFVGTTDAHAFVIKANNTEALRIDPSGKIGVGGLPNSTSKVQVHAQDGVQISGYQPFFTLADTNSGGTLARVQNADGKLVFYTQSALQAGIPSVIFNSLHAPTGSPLPTAIEVHAQDGMTVVGYQPFLTWNDSNSGYQVARIQNADGKLVFYTQSALQAGVPLVVFNSLNAPSGAPLPTAIEVHAQDGMTIVGYQPFLTLNDSAGGYRMARIQTVNGDINLAPQNANGAVVIKSDSGFVGVGTSSPSAKLEVVGDIKVSGDILLPGADCAEHFDLTEGEECEPGTVMVIDDSGALSRCDRAYDRRAAGVVSGAGNHKPGIILDTRDLKRNGLPIALMGKVFCKVDADFWPIEMGDMLTTSATVGHAMKAVDGAKSFGAVIGKALGRLARGKGLLPILISLQ